VAGRAVPPHAAGSRNGHGQAYLGAPSYDLSIFDGQDQVIGRPSKVLADQLPIIGDGRNFHFSSPWSKVLLFSVRRSNGVASCYSAWFENNRVIRIGHQALRP
jgi:hypothetical protein